MKTRHLLTFAAWLGAVALASQSRAYTIQPPGPATAHGALLAVTPGQHGVTQSYPATWTLTITPKGTGKVTGLTSQSATFLNLPWSVKACGLNCLKISGASWSSPSGTCGPLTLPATLANGTIGVNYAVGACEFLTGAVTSPSLTVVP